METLRGVHKSTLTNRSSFRNADGEYAELHAQEERRDERKRPQDRVRSEACFDRYNLEKRLARACGYGARGSPLCVSDICKIPKVVSAHPIFSKRKGSPAHSLERERERATLTSLNHSHTFCVSNLTQGSMAGAERGPMARSRLRRYAKICEAMGPVGLLKN